MDIELLNIIRSVMYTNLETIRLRHNDRHTVNFFMLYHKI